MPQQPPPPSRPESTLRLLSVNARTVDGGTDGLVALVAEHWPDLVAVHGAPHLVRWRQAVGAIARRCGLVVVSGGGRQAGAALLLSTLGVDAGTHRDVRFSGSGGLAPAGGTLAAMRWRGHDFSFAAATLVGNSAVRLGQVRELEAALDELTPEPLPSVLSAEGTDRPGTAAWQAVAEKRVAAAQRVFVDNRFAVPAARTLPGHPFTAPVVADVTIG